MDQTTKDTEIPLMFCNFKIMLTISWLSFQRNPSSASLFLVTWLECYRDADNIHCIKAGTGLRLKRVKRMLYALRCSINMFDVWRLWSQLEEFEDTKVVIRIRISKKNRQHNGQRKKDKRNPTKNREWIQVLWKGQQFLLYQWHRSC